ncbi:MAG: hypothetical protein WA828_03830 [Coleofasciculaceae cyanobacterium]
MLQNEVRTDAISFSFANFSVTRFLARQCQRYLNTPRLSPSAEYALLQHNG